MLNYDLSSLCHADFCCIFYGFVFPLIDHSRFSSLQVCVLACGMGLHMEELKMKG